jgi:tetratricopeptide (TPR) repeat protein
MAMLADSVEVVIGVDTHKHTHTAAVVAAATGQTLASLTVAATPAGYQQLLDLADQHHRQRVWAIESTGGYGAGLTRFLAAHQEQVVELDRPKRAVRRHGAKSGQRIQARRRGRPPGQVELQLPGGRGDAPRLLEEAEATFRELGDRWEEAYAQSGRFAIEAYFGETPRAIRFAEQALEGFRAIDEQRGLAHVGCTQARLARLDAAEASLREAAELTLDTPQPPTVTLLLIGLAWVAAGRGHPELAARLVGAADQLRDRMGVQPAGAELEETELVRLAARSRLGPDAFEAALAAGRTLAPDEALRVALG